MSIPSLTNLFTNPFFYILCLAVTVGLYWLLQPGQPALPIFYFEKTGTPFKHSSLKDEWISPSRLEQLFQWLARRQFTSISPQQLPSLPSKPVWLVFMGGYRSFYSLVFPLLKKYNLKATVFLPTDLIGTYNAWQNPHEEPWQDLINASELEDLKKSNLISFGVLALQTEIPLKANKQNTAFLLRESAYRLLHQQNIQPQAFSNYPTDLTEEQLTTILSGGFSFPFVTTKDGINPLPLTKEPLCSLPVSKRPFYTRLMLWKLRK